MKYFEVEFTISPYSADACDLLAALAGDAGFETFEETETGLLGYVQQSLFSEAALQESIADFPFEGVSIRYDVREAEDRDWNEQWEQEGFEPIVVSRSEECSARSEECSARSEECGVWSENTFEGIIIHDGRHLPSEVSSHLSPLTSRLSPLTSHLLEIEIDARLAFGTGTGILSICALKLGATEAVGYDIDEWSVDNARHNAVINRVDDRFTSLLGDATILNKVEGTFDLVMANINRNILLNDLPLFRQKMAPGSVLILSGFYTADSHLLIDKAATLGLTLRQQQADNDWACLTFRA